MILLGEEDTRCLGPRGLPFLNWCRESSRAVPEYFVYQFMNQCNNLLNRVYPFISDIVDVILFCQCLAVNRSD